MKQVWIAAALIGMCGITFAEIPPDSDMDREPVTASSEKNPGSTIDRPDFKVRNQPAAADRVSASSGSAEGAGMEFEALPRGTQFKPAPEEILSAVPAGLVLRYIDRSDFDKQMTVAQVAAKYMGVSWRDGAGALSADSHVIRWMMMSDSEQRSAKLAWFESAKANILLEEFNRYVDLRAFRVLTALRKSQSPDLRPVEAPKRIKTVEIEKLEMPGIRAVGEPAEGAEEIERVPLPRLRSIREERAEALPDEPSGELLIPPPPLKPYTPSEEEGLPVYEPGKMLDAQPGYTPMFETEPPPAPPEKAPAKAPDADAEAAPETERLPTYFGIPSGLRNAP